MSKNKDLVSFNEAKSKVSKNKQSNDFGLGSSEFNFSLEDSEKTKEFDMNMKFDFDTIVTGGSKVDENL